MSVLKTAYDTTACHGFMMKRTEDAIRVALAHGQLQSVSSDAQQGVVLVRGGAAAVDDIPAFAHPLLLKDLRSEQIIALDVRSFGKWDTNKHEFVIRNPIEYQLAVHRATLNFIWASERQAVLRNVSVLPLAVYASWISEALGRRFALDPREQFQLAILAGIFYNSQFINEGDLDERQKVQLATTLSQALRASASDVLEILDQASVIPSVAQFCALASTVTNSVRLNELNAGLLFAILGGTWYGTNAKEIVAVALEHPPTWIAILMASFNERTYKNSGITKVAERVGTRNGGENFMRSVLNLISVTTTS